MQFDVSVITSNALVLAQGLLDTVVFCVVSVFIGLPLALILSLSRLSRLFWLRAPTAVVVEVIRDTPFLIQVYVAFFVLPAFGIYMEPATAGVLALSLYGAVYYSESIRGAILSVPKGQMDAARATGMSYLLAMRRVIFPQMIGYVIPPLTNQMIGVIKDSAVLSVVAAPELSMATQTVLGNTFAAVEAYTAAAALYWLLTATVAAGMVRLERRSHVYRLKELALLAGQQVETGSSSTTK